MRSKKRTWYHTGSSTADGRTVGRSSIVVHATGYQGSNANLFFPTLTFRFDKWDEDDKIMPMYYFAAI